TAASPQRISAGDFRPSLAVLAGEGGTYFTVMIGLCRMTRAMNVTGRPVRICHERASKRLMPINAPMSGRVLHRLPGALPARARAPNNEPPAGEKNLHRKRLD